MKRKLRYNYLLFIGWLIKVIQSYYRKVYLDQYHVDKKCPNCKQWFSLTGVEHEHKYRYEGNYFTSECGGCGHVSRWNSVIAPFPVLVKNTTLNNDNEG